MTPKPEHVEKAREIVSAWIEAHWPVDDPTPKDRSELDLVDRIALALSDAEKVSGEKFTGELPKTADGIPFGINADLWWIVSEDEDYYGASIGTPIGFTVQSIVRGNHYPAHYKGAFTICDENIEAGNLELWSSKDAALSSLPETHRSVVKPNLTSESALSSLPAARKEAL